MELDLGVEPTSSRITRRSQAATSVTSQTPKTLGRKKQTTTPAKIESSTASAAKNPVKEEEIVHSKPERTPKRSPRSPSTEKREKRNKAKKRFSPSPVTKKRKSILTPRPAVSNDATSIPARKIKIASQAEFTESLNQFKVALEGRGITDFDIPEDWKTPTPSDTVNQIITELSGTLPNISDSSSAAAPPVMV
eukprot:NP_001263835.1 Uncharacterized protein CELE_F54D11.4 [Caenorhabditis elegans]